MTTEQAKLTKVAVAKIDNFFSESNENFLDLDKVSRFIEDYHDGAKFQPIELVSEENGRFTCYDGHHRLAVYRLLFVDSIEAILD